jgi:hypothetical protein
VKGWHKLSAGLTEMHPEEKEAANNISCLNAHHVYAAFQENKQKYTTFQQSEQRDEFRRHM